VTRQSMEQYEEQQHQLFPSSFVDMDSSLLSANGTCAQAVCASSLADCLLVLFSVHAKNKQQFRCQGNTHVTGGAFVQARPRGRRNREGGAGGGGLRGAAARLTRGTPRRGG
jgi:hypothetical protein